MKSSKEIRKEFISFFEKRGHRFVPSSPVVPADDPTLLFTNAGMNQFKAIFLGENKKGYRRVVNSQKCMRVSGKHNDLEEVGRDHQHHTFFEMLGNWSFGDYYKKEAVIWAWELLTKVWKLPTERLFVTVFDTDIEAESIWKSETDIEQSRIMRFGKKDNFWEMGETGPCGPCSEIHYDTGDSETRDEVFRDPVKGVNGENERFVEIWNLVFIQYNRQKDGSLEELSEKHIDTGMGFERIVSILQKKTSNYSTDLFEPVIEQIEKMSGRKYSAGKEGVPFRVIADHIRALVFSIADSGIPSNEGRGYVLRRLLRRAYRFGRELGFREPFMYRLTETVADIMKSAFPEAGMRIDYISDVIKNEEERFSRTLEKGLEIFEQIMRKNRENRKISGKDLFELYDTYGFPVDLTKLMASEKGFDVDEKGFEKEMKAQRDRARQAAKSGDADAFTPVGWIELKPAEGTVFTGYDRCRDRVMVCRYKEIKEKESKVKYHLVLDRTPFYAESGGQAGDSGTLVTDAGSRLQVLDTVKWNDITVHTASADHEIDRVEFEKPLEASVTKEDREKTKRNHTATHLLQAALRNVLGSHVNQSGSRVDSSGLRFDFTHMKSLNKTEIRKVEDIVNRIILENHPVTTEVKNYKEAKKQGATALFGEKYGENVRVVSIEEESKELCGGTHVSSTGEIGLFHIVEESSIAAGVRRILAVTGTALFKDLVDKEDTIEKLCVLLKTSPRELTRRVENLFRHSQDLEEEIKRMRQKDALNETESILEGALKKKTPLKWFIKNIKTTDKSTFGNYMDALSDEIKRRDLGRVVVMIAGEVDGKVLFGASAGKEAVEKYRVHCGELVKTAAKTAGGGGGGNPVRAQAGAKGTQMVGKALEAAEKLLQTKDGSNEK